MAEKLLPETQALVWSTPANCQLTLRVDPELYWFQGHFPEVPILPGVVQLNWARQIARKLWPECHWLAQASDMEAVKFQQVVRPGDCILLELQLDEQARKLRFSYSEGERKFSSGRLVAVV